MKDYLKGVASQATAILLAAFGAAAIAFLQSAASGAGVCSIENVSPQEAGGLGALLKSVHSALLVGRGTIHT